MSRWCVAAIALPLLAATWIVAAPAAQVCHATVVIDDATGAPLRGIEDLAVDFATGALYLSANDRFAGETGTAGLYRIAPGPLPEAGAPIRARDLTTDFKRAHALRPHGIDLIGGSVLVAVNRGAEPTIEVFDVAGDAARHRATIADPLLCRANDVVGIGPGRLLVSSEGATCGTLGRVVEGVAGRADGAVVLVERVGPANAWRARRLVEGIAFANGIALGGPDRRRLYVSATRDRAVRVYRPDGAAWADDGAIPVPGGPDNLVWADRKRTRLLAGVHPSLWRLALYRYRLFGRDHAPARIVAIDVASRRVETLYDDPAGARLSAATVAAARAGRLLIGSVGDDGLLACEAG